jgi:hypothetical protein
MLFIESSAVGPHDFVTDEVRQGACGKLGASTACSLGSNLDITANSTISFPSATIAEPGRVSKDMVLIHGPLTRSNFMRFDSLIIGR